MITLLGSMISMRLGGLCFCSKLDMPYFEGISAPYGGFRMMFEKGLIRHTKALHKPAKSCFSGSGLPMPSKRIPPGIFDKRIDALQGRFILLLLAVVLPGITVLLYPPAHAQSTSINSCSSRGRVPASRASSFFFR